MKIPLRSNQSAEQTSPICCAFMHFGPILDRDRAPVGPYNRPRQWFFCFVFVADELSSLTALGKLSRVSTTEVAQLFSTKKDPKRPPHNSSLNHNNGTWGASSMAPNEEPDASKTRVSSDIPSQTPARPDSRQINEQKKADANDSAFSHPGARILAQRAADGDGPYRCRKCGDAVLTVSVVQCPACLDNHPWFGPADDEEPV
ncbi:hypothetical protein F5888DRAFT_1744638 [Russula emetica]|nr:hypothetical protein F5888DRAFT_1744638 [Russula emetica]